jgi:ABC-type nitrate/sulfonate/bicarbonate transport system permease component
MADVAADAGTAARERRATRLPSAATERIWWLSGLLLVVVVWQLYAAISTNSLIVGPWDVAKAAVELTVSGELWRYARSSAASMTIGMLVGSLMGLLVGLLVGRFRLVEIALDPYISAAYATPLVAIVPVLVVLFGFGLLSKVVIVALFVFFPVAINTTAGVHAVPRDLTELARSFDSTELQTWRDIVIPAALPFIVTGLRLAVGRGLIGVVVAEFETAVTGLGYLILARSRRFLMAESLVPVVVLMLVGFLLYGGLKRVENRMLARRRGA